MCAVRRTRVDQPHTVQAFASIILFIEAYSDDSPTAAVVQQLMKPISY